MTSTTIDFCYPVRRLENSRLALEPFSLSTHAAPFVEGSKAVPELFTYLPYGPFTSVADFETFYKGRIGATNAETWFAILVKPSQPNAEATFAGVVGYLFANAAAATTEIGFITILPAFQRTFVASNAVGLLLQYALDAPPDGLGLRRCQWQANARNEASRRVADRMGFTFEGVQRFVRVLPEGKLGNGYDVSQLPEATGTKLGPARDSAVYAHYCDEWAVKRKGVVAVMERK